MNKLVYVLTFAVLLLYGIIAVGAYFGYQKYQEIVTISDTLKKSANMIEKGKSLKKKLPSKWW